MIYAKLINGKIEFFGVGSQNDENLAAEQKTQGEAACLNFLANRGYTPVSENFFYKN